jgi:hypothetical protein
VAAIRKTKIEIIIFMAIQWGAWTHLGEIARQ